MATYQDIQTRVTRRVIDLPSAVVAEVPNLVNVALYKLQEKHNFKVMEGLMTVVTQVNTGHVLLSIAGSPLVIPSTFRVKEWRGEPWHIRQTDGQGRPLTWAPSEESIFPYFRENDVTNPDIGEPKALFEHTSDDQGNRSVEVFPSADGNSDFPDGEYRIQIPYYRYLPDLSASGDNNWFTNQHSGEEYIVHAAAAEAHGLNWDFEKMAVMGKVADMHMRDIVNADKRYRLGNVRELVPHHRGVHTTYTRV